MTIKKFIFLFFFCFYLLPNGIAQLSQPSYNFDYRILKNLNDIRTPFQDDFQLTISKTTVPLTFGVPVALIGIGLLTKDKDMTRSGIETAAAAGITFTATLLMKNFIRRPRPYLTYPELDNVTTSGSYSFPSGHSSAAFSLATSLSLNYPKWYVIVPAYSYAVATGFSRMYLNVHYPTDVLTGAALGALSAWVTWKISKNQMANSNKRKEELKRLGR